jgi:hypothetical protein
LAEPALCPTGPRGRKRATQWQPDSCIPTPHSIFKNRPPPCSPASENFKFEREDWTLFRTVEGLQQKAGVPATRLRRLVLKEIADNALDTNTGIETGQIDGHGFYVADTGPGIDGAPEDIARLFSIAPYALSSVLCWHRAARWR